MAFNNIEKNVLELVGEDIDSPDVFTDGSDSLKQIRESINDAIEEITMVTGWYREQYRIPLYQDEAFYRLRLTNGQYGWITDARLVNQKRRLSQTSFHLLNERDPRWMIHTGTPDAYFPVGMEVIGFFPAPSSSSDVVEIDMVVIPDRYGDENDRIKLREGYEWAAAYYAVSEYWASRGSAKDALFHHKKYLESIGIGSLYPTAMDAVPRFRTAKADTALQ